MKITVVGIGYVGLSLAVLISQKYKVVALDISKEKVDSINSKKSPIKDKEIEFFLKNKKLDLKATTSEEEAYSESSFIIVATPTNYDFNTGSFDTNSVETVISSAINLNKTATIIIKSTIPLGFTDLIKRKLQFSKIIFSPEFLRESSALYDNLYPSRIIIGAKTKEAQIFSSILIACAQKKESEIPLLLMESREAEAVKLFSNTFLAMRVSFFNELDSFSEAQDLSAEKIIQGVSADPRIGNYYNNPSFGYGGYCLPKDTKQLLDNFDQIPNNIIKAVVEANKTRKDFIVKSILNKKPKTVGVYRLIMKEGSDNFRDSAVIDIFRNLKKKKISILLYEPLISENKFQDVEVINDLNEFISKSNVIIANRMAKDLENVKNKVYTRDIFKEN